MSGRVIAGTAFGDNRDVSHVRRYYAYTLAPDLLKTSFQLEILRSLVESLANEERLTQLLKQFDEQQLEQALERLADFEDAFPAEGAAVAIPIFVNCMGNLSNDMGGFFGIPPQVQGDTSSVRAHE